MLPSIVKSFPMILPILNLSNVEVLWVTVEEEPSSSNLTFSHISSVKVVIIGEKVASYPLHFTIFPISVVKISIRKQQNTSTFFDLNIVLN